MPTAIPKPQPPVPASPAPRPLSSVPKLRIRLVLGEGAMLGPGKAELLTLIRETGSIAAAGRRMGMSYKRAWMLVETLNSMFAAALVDSTRGGSQGGGARLTPDGEAVLSAYRRIEARAAEAAADEIAALSAMHAGPAGGQGATAVGGEDDAARALRRQARSEGGEP